MVDIAKKDVNDIQKSLEYWIYYLQQYNITLESEVAIIAVGSQKDKLSELFDSNISSNNSNSNSSPSSSAKQKQLFKQQLIAERLEEVEHIFATLKQKRLITDSIIVSGKKLKGVDKLIVKIQEYGQEIVNQKSLLIPKSVDSTAKIIQQFLANPTNYTASPSSATSYRLLLSLEEFKKLDPFQSLSSAKIDIVLQLLHNVGLLVLSTATTTNNNNNNNNSNKKRSTRIMEGLICLQPTLLIKMMASFISKENHLTLLFGDKEYMNTLPEDAIFPYSALSKRVKGILELYYNEKLQRNSNSNSNDSTPKNNRKMSTTTTTTTTITNISKTTISDEEVDRWISMMENFSFYYRLNKEERLLYPQNSNSNNNNDSDNNNNNDNKNNHKNTRDDYYLFPSLRPSNGRFCLHSIAKNDEDPHYTLAVRYTRRSGYSINEENGVNHQFIPPYIFSQLQVVSRKYHDRYNQIYSNAMKLHKDSNDAWILPNIHVSTIFIILLLSFVHLLINNIVINIITPITFRISILPESM